MTSNNIVLGNQPKSFLQQIGIHKKYCGVSSEKVLVYEKQL